MCLQRTQTGALLRNQAIGYTHVQCFLVCPPPRPLPPLPHQHDLMHALAFWMEPEVFLILIFLFSLLLFFLKNASFPLPRQE